MGGTLNGFRFVDKKIYDNNWEKGVVSSGEHGEVYSGQTIISNQIYSGGSVTVHSGGKFYGKGSIYSGNIYIADGGTICSATVDNIVLAPDAITDGYLKVYSSFSGIGINNFADDTLILDLTDWDESKWVLMEGSDNAFKGLAEFKSVTLGGQTAAWDGTSWTSSDYKLSLEENNEIKQLTLTSLSA